MSRSRYPLTVWLFALFMAGITSLPYIIAALSAPDGWHVTGAAAVPAGTETDYNGYLSGMWQGWRGHGDYQLLFTHEAHPGVPLVKGFHLLLGFIAKITDLDLVAVYHLARFGLTVIFVLALWSFACRFFDSPLERWLCILFGTIVGGWSWLLLLVPGGTQAGLSPIEFWLIDAFNLLGVFYVAHFAAALTLQIVIVLVADSWIREGGAYRLLILTLALLALTLIQPYVILLTGTLVAVLAVYHLFMTRLLTWRRVWWLALPLGGHAALTLYQYLALRSDPVTAEYIAQNITESPPVKYYVTGYLPFIVPILAGISVFRRDQSKERWLLPVAWTGIVMLLLYAPISVQRRYLIGLQTPLAVLATYGWSRGILPHISPARRPLVTIPYIGLASVALILMIGANYTAAVKPERYPAMFYSRDEYAGYSWLKQAAKPDEVVLTTLNSSGRGSGGRLVAATGQRVFIGYWFETIYFDEKVKQVKQFYDPATADSWRRDFLAAINAQYVWYDDYAREIGSWNPAGVNYLDAVFTSTTVTIYRVRN
jgi:hypothetical protein